MITYNDIREATVKERYSQQLQPIPKNFVGEVAKYLEEKKQISLSGEDAFSDEFIKTKKQLENAIILFKEFIRTRKKKILNLILIASETGISKQDFENMLAFEKELFEELMKNIDVSDKHLNAMLNGKKEKEAKNVMVVFVDDVEGFVGLDGNRMGPYEKGQMANLPKEIVKILVDGGKVELVPVD
jgi:DNA replication initiation complex subunit (GINS family)